MLLSVWRIDWFAGGLVKMGDVLSLARISCLCMKMSANVPCCSSRSEAMVYCDIRAVIGGGV